LSATIPLSRIQYQYPCDTHKSARRESNPRLGPYKDPALTAELRATASGAGGNRTHTLRIKSPLCYQLHHNPANRSGVSVSIAMRSALSFSFMLAVSSVVALRIELSATRLSAVSGQPALDYRFTFHQVGRVGLEPTISCSQNTRASRCPTSRLSSDRNRRTPRRVHSSQVRTDSAVGREALESSSPGLQPSAIPSQLPAHVSLTIRKKPGVVVTPGLVDFP
jgi:hypothetical protein